MSDPSATPPVAGPTPVDPSPPGSHRVVVFASSLLIVALTVVLLVQGRDLLIPLAVAIVIWYVLNALANVYGKPKLFGRPCPGWLSMTASIVTVLIAVALFAEMISGSIAAVSAAAPLYQANLERLITDVSTFAGKRFTLDDSTITFDGTSEIDPLLNIRAANEAPDITALILITGRSSDPKFELTSTPTLPQDEVLARVLFGKSAGALSPLEGLQLAAAIAQLSGKGPAGAGLLDKLRTSLGVDVLEVQGAPNGNDGPSVRAGRYINENTFVGVKQGAEAGSSGVVVEVEVLPNIVVDSEVDQSGANKSGVKWKLDY